MIFAQAEVNNPIWVTVIISLLSLLGGGVGAWLITAYTTKKKEDREDKDQESKTKLSENQQAFELYKEVLITLRSDVKSLNDHIQQIEKEHLQCREDNAKLYGEVNVLKKEMEFLQKQVVVRTELPTKGP